MLVAFRKARNIRLVAVGFFFTNCALTAAMQQKY